jgi:hypothetical protein
VPLVGNVKLEVLSERMVKDGPQSRRYNAPNHNPEGEPGGEKLIVRWRTCGKTRGLGMGALYRGISGSQQVDKITEWLGGDARDDEEFTGLFIFEFDGEGRVENHVIERAQEGRDWDGGRVIGLTEWLLGLAGRGRKEVGGLALGCGKGGGR